MGGETDQLRADQAGRIYTGMRAMGDLPEVSRHPIEHPDIRRRRGALRRHGQQSTIRGEDEIAHDLRRQGDSAGHRSIDEIKEGQFAASGHVPEQGGHDALLVESKAFKFGVITRREHLAGPRQTLRIEYHSAKGGHLPPQVRDQINGPTIGREAAGGRSGRSVVRGQHPLVAAGQVDQEEVVVTAVQHAIQHGVPLVTA
jgi:hypothetical protein